MGLVPLTFIGSCSLEKITSSEILYSNNLYILVFQWLHSYNKNGVTVREPCLPSPFTLKREKEHFTTKILRIGIEMKLLVYHPPLHYRK